MSMRGKCRLVIIQCHWELQASVFAHFAGHICGNHLLSIMTLSCFMSWCDLQAEEQLASLFIREFFQSRMKQVFNKCKLMVKARVDLMLYLLITSCHSCTEALGSWDKNRGSPTSSVNVKQCFWLSLFEWRPLIFCVQQSRKLCLCSH